MATFEIDGVLPVIPTPFTRDGGLDWAALEALLEFAINAGVCGVCLPAYASEFYKLRDVERRELVSRAISILNGRLPIVAQVNHVSTAYVAETARDLEHAGAAAISVAVPRVFGLPERDLLRYFDRILEAIIVPLIIQDFNPGGATVSLEFVKSLSGQHEHFRYLKLEEPMMSGRVRSIIEETNSAVGVIDGCHIGRFCHSHISLYQLFTFNNCPSSKECCAVSTARAFGLRAFSRALIPSFRDCCVCLPGS